MLTTDVTERIDRRRRLLCSGALALAATPLAGCELGGGIDASAQETAMTDAANLPDEGNLASFGGATGWLNSPPLTSADLKGKVILVDFWTFTCINWIRTAPYVKAWARKYKDHGLVVVGVHTPEFGFEHDVGNVTRHAAAMQVEYPIALDPNYAVWSDFDNHYWPAVYIADAKGRIRHHQFGEGDYDRAERIIQALLADAGYDGFEHELVQVDPVGAEVAADWDDLRTGETYVGYGHGDSPASPDGLVAEKPHDYAAPTRLVLNDWGLAGNWTVHQESIILGGAVGRIVVRFHARDVNLVMGSSDSGATVPFRVLIDGQAPGPSHGADVDRDGNGVAGEKGLYQLVRQPGEIVDRQFEIEFLAAGAVAFAFTFG
jgi:thiol-disulfide isomerase/thioredoxin